MLSSRQTFEWNGHRVDYQVIGKGTSETYFAYHGFGRSSEDFALYEPLLNDDQRIVSFDLFFHGGSTINFSDGNPFELVDWHDLNQTLMQKLEVDRFSLLGYSLGGRVAMCTFELFPDRVDRMLLFAPDGLKVNRFYDFISHARIGRALYDYFDKRPERFRTLVSGLQKSKIISKKIGSFAIRHTEDEARRKLVRDVWQTFRNFFPDLDQMDELLNEYRPDFDIFFGEHDVIIKPELGDKAKSYWGEKVNLHSIETGHSAVIPRTIENKRIIHGLQLA